MSEISFWTKYDFTSILVSLGLLLVEISSKESLIFRFLCLNFSLAALHPIKETRLLSPSEKQAQGFDINYIKIWSPCSALKGVG